MKIVELSKQQLEEIENKLDLYDSQFTGVSPEGKISIGIEEPNSGNIIAGLGASMTAFNILYLSNLFVDEKYRRKGYGKLLIKRMEELAKNMGANMIRLDTFSWQGKEFYLAMGYQIVGHYKNNIDNFEEFFFMKNI